MSDINTVLVSGRLVRDVETRTVGENSLSRFSLASNRKFGEKEQTLFLDIDAWGKTGEFAAKHLRKGSAVLVTGNLREDKWTDKESGENRKKIFLVADRVDFLPSSGGKKETADAPVATAESTESDIPF